MMKHVLIVIFILMFTALCACSSGDVAEPTLIGTSVDEPSAAPITDNLADEPNTVPVINTIAINGEECAISDVKSGGGEVTLKVTLPMSIGIDPGPAVHGNMVLKTADGQEIKPEDMINVAIDGSDFVVTLTFRTDEPTDGLLLDYDGQSGLLPQ